MTSPCRPGTCYRRPVDSAAATYFVRVRDKAHGPFALGQLRELAAGGHIGPATEFAPAFDGPWARLATLPFASWVLQPGQESFERLNQSSASPPVHLREIIAAANRPAPNPAPPPRPVTPASAPHDVPSLLQFNLAIEQKHGGHALKPLAERRSRRRRDYFVLVASIAFVIFAILLVECYVAVQVQVLAARMPDQFWPVFHAVLFHSPIFAWGLACFAAIAAALAWLMFVVMDDY